MTPDLGESLDSPPLAKNYLEKANLGDNSTITLTTTPQLAELGEKIISAWKKDKKLDDKIAVDVLNAIFRRCLVETIHISDILRLPPPIRLPIVQAKPKEDEKGE